MKNLAILLITAAILSTACKKASEPGEIQFNGYLSQASDSIYVESVKYLIFNYCEVNEVKDTIQLHDPDFFTHSLKIEIDDSMKSSETINSGYISLPGAKKYFIKKFDFTDMNGNVVFYIPYYNINMVANISLPLLFDVPSGHPSSMTLEIMKK